MPWIPQTLWTFGEALGLLDHEGHLTPKPHLMCLTGNSLAAACVIACQQSGCLLVRLDSPFCGEDPLLWGGVIDREGQIMPP